MIPICLGNISQQPDSGRDCPSPSHHSDDEVEEDQSHVTPFSSQGQETGVTACETTNKNIREILDTLKSYTYVNQGAKVSHKIPLQLDTVQQLFLEALPKRHHLTTLPKPVRERKRKIKNLSQKNTALKAKDGRPAKYRKFSKFSRFADYVVTDLKSCHVESEDVKKETSPNNNDITNTVISTASKRTTCKSERVTQSCKADEDKAKPNRIDHILKPDYWLSSDELFETLTLIKAQFPSIEAQDPLLIQRRQCFNPVDWNSNYCQILHVNGNHWVAVTNIGCKPNHVEYYDSLGGEPSQKALQAIASK